MTKVTIIGQTQGVEPEKKKIEFVKCLSNGKWTNIMQSQEPNQWDNIVLLKLDYYGNDLMYAYSGERFFCLFLGHFNDGIV